MIIETKQLIKTTDYVILTSTYRLQIIDFEPPTTRRGTNSPPQMRGHHYNREKEGVVITKQRPSKHCLFRFPAGGLPYDYETIKSALKKRESSYILLFYEDNSYRFGTLGK